MKSVKIEETILYEDEDIIVCQKPSGFPVQTRKLGSMDMENALKNYLVKKGQSPYVAVVHRLDQPVQGVLVFAKNKESANDLSRQIQQGKIQKIYLAYVQGFPEKKQGCLTDELEKDAKTNTSRVVRGKTENSKKAVLEYKEVKRTEEGTLLEISLQTGRHHQIRVQMAHAGMPIFGDTKYNPQESEEKWKEISLCAYRLSFLHPRTKKKMEFEAKPVGNFPIA